MKNKASESFKALQDSICRDLEALDGLAHFEEDIWQRSGGGGGRTRVIQNGDVIEKGGVNFSSVYGEINDLMQKKLNMPKGEFYAAGISIVLHPKNPHMSIIHMNLRYFELNNKNSWFGGGIDVTPHYINNAEAKFFHKLLKETCDQFDSNYYPDFKKWADDYFYIPHRKETRGIGGIFFDNLSENDQFTLDQRLEFVKGIGNIFIPTYSYLVSNNKERSFNEQQKQWQLIRRGRYVEFNLIYDAGTKFGLESEGRIESILMSLPLQANWVYDFKPLPNSEEEKTLNSLKKNIDWIHEN
jgi:coproporphyrinogen III oxidase